MIGSEAAGLALISTGLIPDLIPTSAEERKLRHLLQSHLSDEREKLLFAVSRSCRLQILSVIDFLRLVASFSVKR